MNIAKGEGDCHCPQHATRAEVRLGSDCHLVPLKRNNSIVPSSRGGTNELDNLALACSGCNGHKHNKIEAPDPIDGTMVPLFHLRQQRWHEHFGWRDAFTKVIGLTTTGRATVELLQINRPGLVNMRYLLYMNGKHPPDFNKG